MLIETLGMQCLILTFNLLTQKLRWENYFLRGNHCAQICNYQAKGYQIFSWQHLFYWSSTKQPSNQLVQNNAFFFSKRDRGWKHLHIPKKLNLNFGWRTTGVNKPLSELYSAFSCPFSTMLPGRDNLQMRQEIVSFNLFLYNMYM